MSAKEMFEKLGLGYYSIDYKKNEIIKILYSDGKNIEITISKKYIDYRKNGKKSLLPTIFIKPISKQLEELGYLDEWKLLNKIESRCEIEN